MGKSYFSTFTDMGLIYYEKRSRTVFQREKRFTAYMTIEKDGDTGWNPFPV
jgi:hypothetical protein